MRPTLSRPLLLTFVSACTRRRRRNRRINHSGPDPPGMRDDSKPSYKFGGGSVLEQLRDVARDLRQLERLLRRRGSENWAGIGNQSRRRITVELKLIRGAAKVARSARVHGVRVTVHGGWQGWRQPERPAT